MNVRTRIKFCGMTRKEDILAAVEMGVDAVGMILYQGSKRAIDLQKAAELTQCIPPFVSLVAVLVNPERSLVQQILRDLPLHCLQFHGEETPEFCESFQFPYIKAIPAVDKNQIMEQSRRYLHAKAILLDTPVNNEHGGTGISFDWDRIPEKLEKPLILAGGLNAQNIGEAVQKIHPYAVDLCSGIEERAGIKDRKKMLAFIQSLQSGEQYVQSAG